MKDNIVYPVVLTKTQDGYIVFVPDLNCNTQGKDLYEALEMARDVIGLMCLDYEDDNKDLPVPSDLFDIKKEKDTDVLTLVDINLIEYRKKNDNKTVRKNLTIPNWLNIAAEKEHINFSNVLQEALIEKLNIVR